MATVRQFEELEVWREAKVLVKAVYLVTGQGKFARDFGLRDQIQRAAVSIMSNIAEGFERGTNKEFVQFLHIAKARRAKSVRSCTSPRKSAISTRKTLPSCTPRCYQSPVASQILSNICNGSRVQQTSNPPNRRNLIT